MSPESTYVVKESVTELTGFQRDVLVALKDIGPCNGQRLKEHLLDAAGYGEVNHGRLYPNLDALVESGYVHRGPSSDRRSNEYKLTNDGMAAFLEYRQWVAGDSE